MTWLAILIITLVCVSFSAGFVLGAALAAVGLRARRPRPPQEGNWSVPTENPGATLYHFVGPVVPFDQEDAE